MPDKKKDFEIELFDSLFGRFLSLQASLEDRKLKFSSVTFSKKLYDSPHFHGWLCMVKGGMRCKLVAAKQKPILKVSKVLPWLVKLH